ncbi:MAG: serine protein kinase RIO [Candidatus Hadarchaeales archaeon]
MSEDFQEFLREGEGWKYERLEKDSEMRKVVERVFDASTLLTLYHMINRGTIDRFGGAVSTGKEAHVFRALNSEGEHVAVKIYRVATSDFKNMYRYLVMDPRFKGIYKDRRQVVYAWASREYKNLQRAGEAGVSAPRALDYEKNVLVMEFIGKGGLPYPRMKDCPPKNPAKTFEKILREVGILYREAKLVHADLSEYNVLLTPDPVLIDFSLGTDISSPMADELLKRDLSNLSNYFRRQGVSVPPLEELLEEVKGGGS